MYEGTQKEMEKFTKKRARATVIQAVGANLGEGHRILELRPRVINQSPACVFRRWPPPAIRTGPGSETKDEGHQ